MKNIIKLTIFFIIILYCNDAHAKLNSKIYVLDGIEYIVIGSAQDKRMITRNSLFRFHQIFSGSLASLSGDYNIRIPSSFKVFLCTTAPVFGQLTGHNWYVAGLYEGEGERFYFQNPDSLGRKGILQKVIRHELCHLIIKVARMDNRFPGMASRFTWLEESFCEALFPVQGKSEVSTAYLLKNIYSINNLKRRLSVGLNSRNRIKRQRAYRLAFVWGSFLLKRLGKKNIFSILVGKYDENILAKHFNSFRNSYR